MKAKLYIFIIIAISIVGCRQTSSFNDFVSQEGGFSVEFPSNPTEHTENLNTPVGPIEQHRFTVELNDIVYTVAYTDYPRDKFATDEPGGLLDAARDGMVANLPGAPVLNELFITLDKYPGRELRIEFEAGGWEATMQSRIFLVDDRLYNIAIMLTKDEATSVGDSDFLDSFKLQE